MSRFVALVVIPLAVGAAATVALSAIDGTLQWTAGVFMAGLTLLFMVGLTMTDPISEARKKRRDAAREAHEREAGDFAWKKRRDNGDTAEGANDAS